MDDRRWHGARSTVVTWNGADSALSSTPFLAQRSEDGGGEMDATSGSTRAGGREMNKWKIAFFIVYGLSIRGVFEAFLNGKLSILHSAVWAFFWPFLIVLSDMVKLARFVFDLVK